MKLSDDLEYFRSQLSGVRRVFLLAGIPFSGKGEWLRESCLPPANIYVNGPFDTSSQRREFVRCARDEGLAVECVWMNPPLEECVRRSRKANGPSIQDLRDMYHRLNTDPPSLEEGFSLIQEIRQSR